MAISQTTRTHLTYQFIILTLLFLGIGYNELLPDRKFIIFLGFVPIFCYQLIILLCCMEFMPVPSWMSFLHVQENKTSSENYEKDFLTCTSMASSRLQSKNTNEERMPYIRRWEKSVTNLRTPAKHFDYPQKSKSWMNLSDSKSLDRLSSEGSVDSLVAFRDKKRPSKAINKEEKARHRVERAAKAKSWKPGAIDFDISGRKEFARGKDLPLKEPSQQTPLPLGCTEIKQEESELAKSYSFPFRQKRLETWLEMKETNASDVTKIPSIPYWQTVGYNLAVKYEARRRRRAMSNPARTESSVSEEQSQKFLTSTEIEPESDNAEKPNAMMSKKSANKTASACMNKLKVGFSNLISKKKEELFESSTPVLNKVGKSPLLFKLKNKNSAGQKDKVPPAMPEFPQFLSNERPLMFYPKSIPFEKERFENDVKKKMLELAEEQKENLQQVV